MFSSLFSPPKRGKKYGHFWADCFFFGRSCTQGGASKKKKEDGVQLKKQHRRFQKNCRLRHRTPLTVRAIIRTFTYGTEEVVPFMWPTVLLLLEDTTPPQETTHGDTTKTKLEKNRVLSPGFVMYHPTADTTPGGNTRNNRTCTCRRRNTAVLAPLPVHRCHAVAPAGWMKFGFRISNQ